MNEELKKRIDDLLAQNKVVLFMKGSALMPQCGFSASAVRSLQEAGATQVTTVNVLQDPEIREGIKEYSSWPTIPQVFVDGKFIGGSDILKEMQDRGELAPLVNPGS